jgi:hypothetical protein
VTIFLRLLGEVDKAASLQSNCMSLRAGNTDGDVFEVSMDSLGVIPGTPFAYWVSSEIRDAFRNLAVFESEDRTARVGLQSSDDFRFLRTWWETKSGAKRWHGFAKGGTHSPFYADVYMQVNWLEDGAELKSWAASLYGSWSRIIKNVDYYFLPGHFQTLRASRLAPHLTPRGCVFSDNGTQAFCNEGDVLAVLALLNSSAADYLHKLLLGRSGYALYRNGTLARLPVPSLASKHKILSSLAAACWSKRRMLDEVEETSHAFTLPAALRGRLGAYDRSVIESEVSVIERKIDEIAFELYGISEEDRETVRAFQRGGGELQLSDDEEETADEADDDDVVIPVSEDDGLLSWAVGVAFGHFDWRLATGERPAPINPEPIDPLPTKSAGMLPEGADPFHTNAGILVDDPGHQFDLTRVVEEVLTRVDVAVPTDLRRLLQKEFFAFHLRRYTKSRRKAPVYWPISTVSGSYTLWFFYPRLTSESLYVAINDFLDGPTGKLEEVGALVAALRNKGSGRSRDDDKQFEALQGFELELIELRDRLLQLAPTYKPSHDDGVQISAAPLWPLFRHKPWQKLLKDTWAKLEKGDYDWSHLAMNYWPDRVREKCRTDKSLAIAHGLESLFVEPEATPKKTRGRKKGAEE